MHTLADMIEEAKRRDRAELRTRRQIATAERIRKHRLEFGTARRYLVSYPAQAVNTTGGQHVGYTR